MFFKFCQKCGAGLSFRAAVCSECGARARKATVAERFQLGCMILVLVWFGLMIGVGAYLLIDRPLF
jgi:ribosomal protein L40E